MNYTLECKGLTKVYSGGVHALNQVNIALQPGRIVGLLGPNGSGKTTLIKLAAGLLVPTGGEILVAGSVPGPESKARVSYLPDKTYLPNWMRAKDVIAYYADFYNNFFDTAGYRYAGPPEH